jgi:hypothetical protein
MSRLCFLFNHDHVHQVAHSLPIALSMAASGRHDVVVASGSPTMTAFLRKAMGESANIPIIELGLKRTTTRLAGALFEPFLPARKILLYRDNLDFFDGFDALVVSEKTSLILKTHYGLSALKIIHTRHGAGDRAIGFDPESRHFDLSLVAGPKIARRLVEQAGVAIEKIVVTGYPKFELHGENRVASPFPDPSRKTVLYVTSAIELVQMRTGRAGSLCPKPGIQSPLRAACHAVQPPMGRDNSTACLPAGAADPGPYSRL